MIEDPQFFLSDANGDFLRILSEDENYSLADAGLASTPIEEVSENNGVVILPGDEYVYI